MYLVGEGGRGGVTVLQLCSKPGTVVLGVLPPCSLILRRRVPHQQRTTTECRIDETPSQGSLLRSATRREVRLAWERLQCGATLAPAGQPRVLQAELKPSKGKDATAPNPPNMTEGESCQQPINTAVGSNKVQILVVIVLKWIFFFRVCT